MGASRYVDRIQTRCRARPALDLHPQPIHAWRQNALDRPSDRNAHARIFYGYRIRERESRYRDALFVQNLNSYFTAENGLRVHKDTRGRSLNPERYGQKAA